jgi:tetratricopeptide (TPR) repeat protein
MQQRFVAVGGVAGADTFARVKHLMEPETAAWARASSVACTQPVSLAHERCLESRGRLLQSLSGLFVNADRDVVAGALTAVRLEVLPVAGCLTTSVSSPRVVPDTEADQDLRPELARVRFLRASGMYREAALAALAVGEQARAKGAVRVQAEAQLLAGQVYSQLKDPQTETTLKNAVLFAEQASADEERARAWMSLISWYGGHDNLDAAILASEQVDSILERLGRPDHLEAQYQNQRGQLLKLQGDLPEAAKAFKRSYDIWRRHYGESDPQVVLALTNYALTLPADEARVHLEKVLKTRIETFGPQHPETASAAYNLGIVLTELESPDAVVELKRALEIRQGQKPPDPCRLAETHFASARAWDALRDVKKSRLEQRVGLDLALGAECPNFDLQPELEYLLLVEQLNEKPESALQPIRKLIELLQKKETLPKNLPP